MWALENDTPYAVDRTWVLDSNGAKVWVVVVKGTWDILPDGTTALAKKQEEPLFLPKYSGEDGQSSIVYDMDMVPTKKATDVILNGHAWAPGGEPVRSVDVTMRVGSLVKTLRVFGDRQWDHGLGLTSRTPPVPFKSMPLLYERAFGGFDQRAEDPAEHRLYEPNPVGTGFATSRAHLGGQRMPNLEDPGDLIHSWNARPRPMGLGAIASYWSPRRERAGTYDERWKKERFPLYPADFDDRFFQCAPDEQQIAGFARGGERVDLENLTPRGRLSFHLPKIGLVFSTRIGREMKEHRSRLHTILLEPDVPRVILVWHTSLPCHRHADRLDWTRIGEKIYL